MATYRETEATSHPSNGETVESDIEALSHFMTYEQHRTALIEYLRAKLAVEDWHGVRDCCVDIEVLDAAQRAREAMTPKETLKGAGGTVSFGR